MAPLPKLPKFVKNATSADDGVTNSLAASMAKLKLAKNGMTSKLSGVDGALGSIDSGNLPDLPTTDALNGAASQAESITMSKLSDFDEIEDLAGGCLGGALSAMKSIGNDAFGLLGDGLNAFSGIPDMPSEMFNVFGIFGEVQQFIASLGIDKLVADITSKLGCLSDSSMITDIQSEVASSMSFLGLDSSGMPDDDVYYEKMKSTMMNSDSMAGVDPNFTNSMSDGLKVMTTKSNELAGVAKLSADSQIGSAKQRIKDSVPKTPTPPSFF